MAVSLAGCVLKNATLRCMVAAADFGHSENLRGFCIQRASLQKLAFSRNRESVRILDLAKRTHIPTGLPVGQKFGARKSVFALPCGGKLVSRAY
jgi:hypothetical protein